LAGLEILFEVTVVSRGYRQFSFSYVQARNKESAATSQDDGPSADKKTQPQRHFFLPFHLYGMSLHNSKLHGATEKLEFMRVAPPTPITIKAKVSVLVPLMSTGI
jgi:hypothetical protein